MKNVKLFLLCFFAAQISFAQAPVKISALPIATGTGAGNYIPIVQGGITKKILVDSILKNIPTINAAATLAGLLAPSDFTVFTNKQNRDTITILGSGQSNMKGGADDVVDTVHHPGVIAFDSVTNTWKPYIVGKPPMRYISGNSPTSLFYLARKLARQKNCIVKVIVIAEGGKPISFWHDGINRGSYLQSIINNVERAGSPRIDYFVWDQGESDNAATNVYYTNAFDSIKSTLRGFGWFPRTTPIAIVGMPRLAKGSVNDFTIIDNILQGFDNNNDVYDGYTSTDSALLSTVSPRIHFSCAGLKYLGENEIWSTLKSLPNTYQSTKLPNNGVQLNNGYLQLGGQLAKNTIVEIGNNQLWLKTPYKNAVDSSDVGGVTIGDQLPIPVSTSPTGTNGKNAALRINKDGTNQLNNPSLLYMGSANTGYKNGWLFSNYNGGGFQFPRLTTWAQSSIFSYYHSISGKSNAQFGGYFLDVGDQDSILLNKYRVVVNTNLFSVSNANNIKFLVRNDGKVKIGDVLNGSQIPLAKLHILGTSLSTDTTGLAETNGHYIASFMNEHGYGAIALSTEGNTGVTKIIASNGLENLFSLPDRPTGTYTLATTTDPVPEHADNAAAIAAGLPINTRYRTGDILKIVH